MEYLIVIISTSIGLFLRIWVIQYYRNKRFETFKILYPDEPFEKLSEYEEKSKEKFFQLKNINDS